MIDEILFGGTYSNQVSTLEEKIDALALGMHSIEDKLDMIKTAFDRSFDIELDALPERHYGVLKSSCTCKDDEVA